MIMKKIIPIIAAGMLLMMINTARAQTFGDFRKMTADQKTQLISDSLKVNLQLTDAEYKQVYTIVYEAFTKIAPIVKGSGDRIEKRQQALAVLADSRAKLKAVLTPQQVAVLEAKRTKLMAYYREKLANQPILFNAPTN
jgi:hypothetical protein